MFTVSADEVNDQRQAMNFVLTPGSPAGLEWCRAICERISRNPDKMRRLNLEAAKPGGGEAGVHDFGEVWRRFVEHQVESELSDFAQAFTDEARMMASLSDLAVTTAFDSFLWFEYRNIHQLAAKGLRSREEGADYASKGVRLGRLLSLKQLFLNSISRLRNPHNVAYWFERVVLLGSRRDLVFNAYHEAVRTIDPKLAEGGSLSHLWIHFAGFCEIHKQVDTARMIFADAARVHYATVDQLAEVWIASIQLELRLNNPGMALQLCCSALSAPSPEFTSQTQEGEVKTYLHESHELWHLYIELQRGYGTPESVEGAVCHAYDALGRNAQVAFNSAFLFEKLDRPFEASRCYGRAILMSQWPEAYNIWYTFMTKFVARFGSSSVGATGELLLLCLQKCKHEYTRAAILAQFEVACGQPQNAAAIGAATAELPETSAVPDSGSDASSIIDVETEDPLSDTGVIEVADLTGEELAGDGGSLDSSRDEEEVVGELSSGDEGPASQLSLDDAPVPLEGSWRPWGEVRQRGTKRARGECTTCTDES